MLDRALIKAVSGGLQWIATALIHKGVKADMVSWAGFLIGMAAVPLIITQNYHWALVCIGLNRLADGLDGTIARLTKPTDRGAFRYLSRFPVLFCDPVRICSCSSREECACCNGINLQFCRYRLYLPGFRCYGRQTGINQHTLSS